MQHRLVNVKNKVTYLHCSFLLLTLTAYLNKAQPANVLIQLFMLLFWSMYVKYMLGSPPPFTLVPPPLHLQLLLQSDKWISVLFSSHRVCSTARRPVGNRLTNLLHYEIRGGGEIMVVNRSLMYAVYFQIRKTSPVTWSCKHKITICSCIRFH